MGYDGYDRQHSGAAKDTCRLRLWEENGALRHMETKLSSWTSELRACALELSNLQCCAPSTTLSPSLLRNPTEKRRYHWDMSAAPERCYYTERNQIKSVWTSTPQASPKCTPGMPVGAPIARVLDLCTSFSIRGPPS